MQTDNSLLKLYLVEYCLHYSDIPRKNYFVFLNFN